MSHIRNSRNDKHVSVLSNPNNLLYRPQKLPAFAPMGLTDDDYKKDFIQVKQGWEPLQFTNNLVLAKDKVGIPNDFQNRREQQTRNDRFHPLVDTSYMVRQETKPYEFSNQRTNMFIQVDRKVERMQYSGNTYTYVDNKSTPYVDRMIYRSKYR